MAYETTRGPRAPNLAPTDPVLAPDVESLPNPFARISWGGIFAGVFIVLALQVLLNMIGVGIGLSTVEPMTGDTPSATAMTVGAGLWFVVSSWIALVAGGYVASRLAGSYHRQDALLHGLVTWGFTLVLIVVLAAGAVGGAVRAASGMIGGAARVAGQAAGAAAPQLAQNAGQQNAGQQNAGQPGGSAAGGPDLRGLIAGAIEPADPARMTPEQQDAAIVRETTQLIANPDPTGVNRDRLTQLIAARTGLSPQEAAARLQDVEKRGREAVDQARQTAREAADAAARAGTQAALWGAVALVLGAIAAAVGGLVGRHHALAWRRLPG
ncbi:MAG: hypothetical protein U1E53_27585 [Dongiaceae bacterium]